MKSKRIVVVGAGIGGLTSALLLAANGCDVTLVER
ncbi:MAG: FAD-dependent oxidoreductase, partial [Hyphomicrobium sp.]